MRRLDMLVILAALSLAPAAAAHAVETATAREGLALACERCGSCHGVEYGDEFSANPFAPTFEAIADTPGMTATALSVSLRTSHQLMPDLMLASEEIAALAAYIETLKE
jgi:mono/diheme cytochrome c family protein